MEFTLLQPRESTLSFGSPLDTKEQVRQAIDIVDLVGKYIQLRRQGRNYVGLCPWHDDSKPSLQVNPERQSWKCWPCDIGGDIFSFTMKIEGVEFREALEILADQAGISVTPFSPSRPAAPLGGPSVDESGEPIPSEMSPQDRKRSLFRAMAWAETQYHECLLKSPEAEPARRYLTDRGITDESIATFHLGFCPAQYDWMVNRVKGDASRIRTLESIGVLKRGDGGGTPYDLLRGRVLFSIRDAQERPVGLGGRLLPELGLKSKAKYINSPETPLFSKSRLLYGLDVARQAMRKTDRALVMEGYTDCIVAHQHGFRDAVAVLGVALGEEHIRILKRFVKQVVLVLDGDEAGQRRTGEVLELFVAQSVDLRILTLPEGADPCDFLQQQGTEAFQNLLDTRAVDPLEHAFNMATRGVDLVNDIQAATEAMERILAIIAKAPRLSSQTGSDMRLREERMLARLSTSFRMPEQAVRDRLKQLRREPQRAPMSRPPVEEYPYEEEHEIEPVGPLDPWHRELLEILLRRPEAILVLREEIQLGDLKHGWCRLVFQKCTQWIEQGIEPTFDRLMLEFDDPSIKGLLVEVDERVSDKGDVDVDTLIAELLRSFRHRVSDQQKPHDAGILREGGLEEEEQLDLLRRIEQQAKARQGISDPMEGQDQAELDQGSEDEDENDDDVF